MQSRGVRRPSVCPSVRLSVNFAQIATSTTEVAGSPPNLHTMVHMGLHPGCAQGQGQGQLELVLYIGLIFAADSVGLPSFRFSWWAPKRYAC